MLIGKLGFQTVNFVTKTKIVTSFHQAFFGLQNTQKITPKPVVVHREHHQAVYSVASFSLKVFIWERQHRNKINSYLNLSRDFTTDEIRRLCFGQQEPFILRLGCSFLTSNFLRSRFMCLSLYKCLSSSTEHWTRLCMKTEISGFLRSLPAAES